MAIIRFGEATLLKGEAKYQSDTSSAKRVFYASFDTPPADHDDVYAQFVGHSGLDIGVQLKPGDSRVLDAITPASMGSTLDYMFELEYKVPSTSVDALNPNPLLRPDEISLTGSVSTKTYFQDYSDTPKCLLTTAGEPYETLPERDVGSFDIPIKGNRASINVALWASYLYPVCAINSDNVTIRGISFTPGQLKLRPFRASPKFENNTRYLEIEWTVACAENWDQKLLSRGYFEKVDGKLRRITLPNGKDFPTAPWPLDADGKKKPLPTDDPYEQTFKPYPKKPFGIFAWTAAS